MNYQILLNHVFAVIIYTSNIKTVGCVKTILSVISCSHTHSKSHKGKQNALSLSTEWSFSKFASGGRQFGNPKAEQTMWVALIDHLRSNDKLPVVAFTLSRNR